MRTVVFTLVQKGIYVKTEIIRKNLKVKPLFLQVKKEFLKVSDQFLGVSSDAPS